APPATPPSATTPRPTCCTRRCVGASARTSTRPAPTSAPTSCASISPTEARRLGAMALFGEKYGDVVRMVEVGDGSFSRELCGGTHVRFTSEIGLFKVTGESSSAANVRRIEALTGPEAVGLMRRHDAILGEVAARMRTRPEHVLDAVE